MSPFTLFLIRCAGACLVGVSGVVWCAWLAWHGNDWRTAGAVVLLTLAVVAPPADQLDALRGILRDGA